MKIKDYKCRCGHDDFFLFTPENCIGENRVGIYCSLCGKWFKWANKDEKRLAIEKNLTMNCVTKIRNDLVKNGDDLIKRQDAIEHIKKRLYESAENNIGLMCMADHVFTEIADNRINTWIEDVPSAQVPPYDAEIEAEYKKAVSQPWIHKPLAKALYEVWKKHDREDVSRHER